jgi:predicted ester cyclase
VEAGTTADSESIARGYFDAVARRDIGAMASFWEPGAPDVIHGVVEMTVPDDLHAWFGNLFAAFPDFSFAVLDVIAGSEKVAVRWHATGTFSGSGKFEGLLPNGRRVDVEGCDVLTIRDGLIRRNDAHLNGAEMARQLGALPPAGSPPERALSAVLNLKTRIAGRLQRR